MPPIPSLLQLIDEDDSSNESSCHVTTIFGVRSIPRESPGIGPATYHRVVIDEMALEERILVAEVHDDLLSNHLPGLIMLQEWMLLVDWIILVQPAVRKEDQVVFEVFSGRPTNNGRRWRGRPSGHRRCATGFQLSRWSCQWSEAWKWVSCQRTVSPVLVLGEPARHEEPGRSCRRTVSPYFCWRRVLILTTSLPVAKTASRAAVLDGSHLHTVRLWCAGPVHDWLRCPDAPISVGRQGRARAADCKQGQHEGAHRTTDNGRDNAHMSGPFSQGQRREVAALVGSRA